MADAEKPQEQTPQEQKQQQQQQRGRQGGKKESKQDRKAQKAAAAEERRRKEIEAARAELEKYKHLIGDLPLIQSKNEDFKKRPYVSVGELDKSFIGKSVLVRARVHFSMVKGLIHLFIFLFFIFYFLFFIFYFLFFIFYFLFLFLFFFVSSCSTILLDLCPFKTYMNLLCRWCLLHSSP